MKAASVEVHLLKELAHSFSLIAWFTGALKSPRKKIMSLKSP